MGGEKMSQKEEKFVPAPEGDAPSVNPILQNFLEKRSWQVGGLITGVILLIFISSSFGGKGAKDQKDSSPLGDPKREVYKETDLKEMITQEEVQKNVKKSAPAAISRKERRNFATEMAVYVFQDKEIKTEGHALERKAEKKKLGLSSGTKIPAALSGSIFSFNVASPVVVVVLKDIEKNGGVVIPKGSKFLGDAAVLKSLDRINVTFSLLIFPDGREIRVHALALSEDGSSGIKGRVEKHRDTKVFKAIGETLLAGASLFTGGVRSDPYAMEDQIRMNLAQNLTQEAREDLRSVTTDTSITVQSYTPIEVILLESI